MKLSNNRFALILPFTLLLLLLHPGGAQSVLVAKPNADVSWGIHQEGDPEFLSSGMYLVIGVFEYEKNAQRMVKSASKEGLEADYKFYQASGYFYVFVSNSEKKTGILEDYKTVRSLTSYSDAWILRVSDESSDTVTVNNSLSQSETSIDAPGMHFSDDASTSRQSNVPELSGTQTEASIPDKQQTVIVIQTLNAQNGQIVDASIELVDGLRAKLISKINSGTPWELEQQKSLDTVQVISEALGFRKMQLDLIPNAPINDTTALYTRVENDTIYLQMDLMELQQGDFQILYNTYFYGNATVMRDQSRYELEKLYQIMDDQPNMRIRLHGHTNGNSRGVAYLFKEEEKNYFDIRRTREYTKKGVSSRKLSAYRAETIKSYLINKGIKSERIETQGWGGKKLLYDTDSPLAKNNIRVEIEVLSK